MVFPLFSLLCAAVNFNFILILINFGFMLCNSNFVCTTTYYYVLFNWRCMYVWYVQLNSTYLLTYFYSQLWLECNYKIWLVHTKRPQWISKCSAVKLRGDIIYICKPCMVEDTPAVQRPIRSAEDRIRFTIEVHLLDGQTAGGVIGIKIQQ